MGQCLPKRPKKKWSSQKRKTTADNTQCELIDKDDTCSMEQASAARAGDHGPGLQNQGSNCYLNTVLQILFMTDECREAVMRLNEADGNPVSEQLKKLFDKHNRNQVPDTSGIIHSLGITDLCRQEDASKYFQKILSKVNPVVTKIYEGTIKETVTCENKHQLKECSIPFTLIPLSINNPSSGIISVEDAWKDHFKSTEATVYCSSCESETLAQFESKINAFPQILALHLDRLDIFPGQKNTCKVKIPSTLTNKGWTYELYAIANHHGSPRGGHYKAFIKPYGDESWWIFDDSHVRKMEELQRENLLNSPAADLLFYKKISSDDLKAENTLEKGNDSYPSQDHRKRPSRSKPEKEEEEEKKKKKKKKEEEEMKKKKKKEEKKKEQEEKRKKKEEKKKKEQEEKRKKKEEKKKKEEEEEEKKKKKKEEEKKKEKEEKKKKEEKKEKEEVEKKKKIEEKKEKKEKEEEKKKKIEEKKKKIEEKKKKEEMKKKS